MGKFRIYEYTSNTKTGWLCSDCGAVVVNKDAHDKWHDSHPVWVKEQHEAAPTIDPRANVVCTTCSKPIIYNNGCWLHVYDHKIKAVSSGTSKITDPLEPGWLTTVMATVQKEAESIRKAIATIATPIYIRGTGLDVDAACMDQPKYPSSGSYQKVHLERSVGSTGLNKEFTTVVMLYDAKRSIGDWVRAYGLEWHVVGFGNANTFDIAQRLPYVPV